MNVDDDGSADEAQLKVLYISQFKVFEHTPTSSPSIHVQLTHPQWTSHGRQQFTLWQQLAAAWQATSNDAAARNDTNGSDGTPNASDPSAHATPHESAPISRHRSAEKERKTDDGSSSGTGKDKSKRASRELANPSAQSQSRRRKDSTVTTVDEAAALDISIVSQQQERERYAAAQCPTLAGKLSGNLLLDMAVAVEVSKYIPAPASTLSTTADATGTATPPQQQAVPKQPDGEFYNVYISYEQQTLPQLHESCLTLRFQCYTLQCIQHTVYAPLSNATAQPTTTLSYGATAGTVLYKSKKFLINGVLYKQYYVECNPANSSSPSPTPSSTSIHQYGNNRLYDHIQSSVELQAYVQGVLAQALLAPFGLPSAAQGWSELWHDWINVYAIRSLIPYLETLLAFW